MNANDERDHSEETYNRNLCPECDQSPCVGGAGRGSCCVECDPFASDRFDEFGNLIAETS